MTTLLPCALTTRDLSPAELSSMRLDGDGIPLDESIVPYARLGLDDAATRMRALSAQVPRRLIVERSSALWVHGGLPAPPAVHTLCMSRDRRVRSPLSPRLEVRETNVSPEQLLRLEGVSVTSPGRTIFDVAAHPNELLPALFRACLVVARRHAGALDDADRIADAAAGAPRTREARRRIARLRAAYAARSVPLSLR